MDGLETAHILLYMGDTTTDHGTEKNRIGRDKIVAEDISQTIRTITAIRIL